MSDKIILCRRDKGTIGTKDLCAKPITVPNNVDWCIDCYKRLPFWPVEVNQ